VAVADAHVEVAVDAVEVHEIQLFERVAVTALRPFDQPPDLRGRLAASRRRGLLEAVVSHPQECAHGGRAKTPAC
jgi:hypothetical protein